MTDAKDTSQASLSNLPVKAGQRYRHFKGGEYEIVALAVQEDTLEPLVVYRSISNGSIWARTYKNFTEVLDRPEYNYRGPRFVMTT